MKAKEWILLCLVLFLSIGIKATLFLREPIVPRDGIHFIHFAQQLDAKPWNEALLEHPYHPLYPVLIWGTHSLLFSSDSSPVSWHQSALLVSCAMGTLLLLPLFFVARTFVREWAVLVPLLFVILPVTSQITSDALAEATLLFWEWASILCVVRGLSTGKIRYWLFAGLFAGLGYLTRPEAISIPIVAMLTLILKKRTESSNSTFKQLLPMLIALLILCLPYMLLLGRISARPSTQQLLLVQQKESLFPASILLASRTESTSFTQAITTLCIELSKATSYLFLISLLPLWQLLRHLRHLNAEKLFLLLLCIVNVLMLFWLAYRANYLSERHCLLLVIMNLIAFTYALRLASLYLTSHPAWAKYTRYQPWTITGSVAIVLAITLPFTLRPLHQKQKEHKQLGEEVAKVLKPDEVFVDPIGFARFYAGLPPVTGDWVKDVTSETRTLYFLADLQEDDSHRLHQFERALKNHPHKVLLQRPHAKPRYVVFKRILK